MVTAKPPWDELESGFQILFKVGGGNLPKFPTDITENCNDFLRRCFHSEPKDRLTAANLLEHNFIKDVG